jgi:hypothetical protein
MRKVLAVLCGVTMSLAACGVPGGVEVAGPASQVSPPPTTQPLPSGTPASTDAIAVLRADPALNPKIKTMLVPCTDGSYPVDDRYADFTGDGMAELLVTVYACAEDARDAKVQASGMPYYGGIAGYVYNLKTKPPTRLFAVEDSAVEFVPSYKDGRELLVIHNRWGPRDEPCCPTEQDVTLYQWDGARFEVVK